MTSKKYPVVLTIAGSDSSGGAGIQADIKTISAIGCYAASAITAITAQNTLGVQNAFGLSSNIIIQQIDAVLSDLSVQAIKIGMLFNQNVISAVVDSLKKYRIKNIVLDPVMVSKSGCELLASDAIEILKTNLFPICKLITPNIFEAEKLVGRKITNRQMMTFAAQEIGNQYQVNVLVKGGHLDDAEAFDVFYDFAESHFQSFVSPRISTKNTHGTGCTLSAAIAAFLALNHDLKDAIAKAKTFLVQAISAGHDLSLGKGIGPVDHFYAQRCLYD